MEYLVKTFLALLFALPVMRAENEPPDLEYGKRSFDYLRRRYPHHFILKSTTGKHVPITEKENIGAFIVSKFSTKTASGRIYCIGRSPIGDSPQIVSQCIFYETLNIGRDGVEILLSPIFDDKDSSTLLFWRAFIFELCNANYGKEFIQLRQGLADGDFDRHDLTIRTISIEWKSARDAHVIQNDIWRPFCNTHDITCKNTNWYFPDGTTIEQWIDMLKSTAKGNAYIEYYQRQPFCKEGDRHRLPLKEPSSKDTIK